MLLVLAIGAGGLAQNNSTLTSERSSLQASIDSGNKQIQSLRSQLSSSESDKTDLSAQLSALQIRVDGLQGQVDVLDERAAALDTREAGLDTREQSLNAQAKDLTKREKAVGIIEKSSFGDGLYKVGSDIKAGTYHTSGGSSCYWAKLGSSDTFDIIDNSINKGPQTIVIGSAWFESDGCGTWSLSG